MGKNVIAVENLIDGLHIRGVGTFGLGAIWNIDNVPEALIKKCLAKETAKTPSGKISPLCVFVCPDGAKIPIEEAFIPRFNVGKPPVPPKEYVSSGKSRVEEPEVDEPEKVESNDEVKLKDSEEEVVSTDSSDEDSTSTDKPKKKKKKFNLTRSG